MLPKSVAEQLKLGQIVTAEYYDSCTIYFRYLISFVCLIIKILNFYLVILLDLQILQVNVNLLIL